MFHDLPRFVPVRWACLESSSATLAEGNAVQRSWSCFRPWDPVITSSGAYFSRRLRTLTLLCLWASDDLTTTTRVVFHRAVCCCSARSLCFRVTSTCLRTAKQGLSVPFLGTLLTYKRLRLVLQLNAPSDPFPSDTHQPERAIGALCLLAPLASPAEPLIFDY